MQNEIVFICCSIGRVERAPNECMLVQPFDLHDKVLFGALIWCNWVEVISRGPKEIMICWAAIKTSSIKCCNEARGEKEICELTISIQIKRQSVLILIS